MNELTKSFITGGVITALVHTFINEDTHDLKYTSIILHGIPVVFLSTLIVQQNNHKMQKLVYYGIFVSLIITITMTFLYLQLKSQVNKLNALISSILIWALLMHIFLKL